PGFYAKRWASRPSAGAATLARAEHELPALIEAIVKAAAEGRRDSLRQAATSTALRVAPLGAVGFEQALRRFAYASASEEFDVLETRAGHLGPRWEKVFAQAKLEASRAT
ncbi:MAG TPA: hypothetical protein VMV44_11505, partial [Rectinemataceae bacterium]|nr:hypothetical protein [Rectinemataceae bacterium]